MTIALAMIACLEDQLHALRHQLLDAARHMRGAKVLAERLHGAGLDSMPGDDAGVLDDSVRGQIAPNGSLAATCSAAEWVEVHRTAHGLGMPTTAAMTFGAGETFEQRVDHLDALRRLQEDRCRSARPGVRCCIDMQPARSAA